MDTVEMLQTAKLVGGLGFAWFSMHVLCNLFVRPVFLRMLLNNPKLADNAAKREKVSYMLAPRVVCFVHNIIQIPLALWILTQSKYYTSKALGHDDFSSTVMAISAGYFIYDSLECIVNYSSEGPAFVIHGVACLLVYTTLLHCSILHWFGAGFLLWELSTPFLHLRWFLIQVGRGRSALFDAVQKGGFLTFFLVRIVWGYYLSYQYWLTSFEMVRSPEVLARVPMLLINIWRAFTALLNGLNTHWFAAMVKIALAPAPAAKQVKVN